MNLQSKLVEIKRLSELQKRALLRLGLITVFDLLHYFPVRYGDVSMRTSINEVTAGVPTTIYGKIIKVSVKKSFKTKIPMAEMVLEDLTGKVKAIWFNQPFIGKTFKLGEVVKISGTPTLAKNSLLFANPEIEQADIMNIDTHDSLFQTQGNDINEGEYAGGGYPIYRETKGITSKFLYHLILTIIKTGILDTEPDPLPVDILSKYNLPKFKTAILWMHTPKKTEHAQAARKRFAFEEIFYVQLARNKDKKLFQSQKSYEIVADMNLANEFLERLPFPPTNAQHLAIKNIFDDLVKQTPMARLLEGDVGSGKTAVAAAATYAIIRNRPAQQNFGTLQMALMAPTEILATQHFEGFIQMFAHTGISICLITGRGCRKYPSKVASNTKGWTDISRTQLSKWVANGEIAVVIGTHALIQKNVAFKHLALAIVDEQHRFGAKQRAGLVKKGTHVPHFLSMTATPIPRTLALTIYGDLDLSVLDEMPKGRKPVITEIIAPHDRQRMYKNIVSELQNGRQAYVICPRINAPDEADAEEVAKIQMKNVTTEAKRLEQDELKGFRIGIMHSKMNAKKKEEVMDDFYNHEIDVLVSTSVVEVGVNVPNATNIIIEGAERFGLAQLHQLRGRVIRSSTQAYCYILTDSESVKTTERLGALTKAKNGFELAEMDLLQRGAGVMTGTKQWGISDLAMEAIKNIKLVEAARTEAQNLIETDTLKNYPILDKISEAYRTENHFE
ncbi:hypothetical protein A3J61_02295 [Candidatus Nomurabacteria bacterium RIFCSPHIGHO2_02_FULL_38_15]|uniref:Probable DNA 3'-5' helicase RecG n=1 Tax=Candidatus Nomurabacteria bacterium RIFCSPHIGHO2_02_FULL_38_15 TaxID=1801752 RepID=A0A1F6VQF9_9BACT|nr:MAG: hypothetical protein A3J61_02295 [Candidatus Nomurabacteria bacterium RIFCSPHIGHO2_02_FULL_38_15]